MLAELRVRDLGVIEDLALVLTPGMTALTGETGAGKTLVVEAIELLVGGKADPMVVRPGAAEAVVEGRFTRDSRDCRHHESGDGDPGDDEAGDDDPIDELILGRTIPASG